MEKIGRCFYVLEGAGWLQCFPASLAMFKRSKQRFVWPSHADNFHTIFRGMMAHKGPIQRQLSLCLEALRAIRETMYLGLHQHLIYQ